MVRSLSRRRVRPRLALVISRCRSFCPLRSPVRWSRNPPIGRRRSTGSSISVTVRRTPSSSRSTSRITPIGRSISIGTKTATSPTTVTVPGTRRDGKGRAQYGVMDVPLRASYGTPTRETSSANYVLGIYRFTGTPSPFMYRQSARLGSVEIAGKIHKAVLVENDADGVFNKPVETEAQAAKTRPVWMKIDLNDDGKYASGILDIRAPFKLGDATYEANLSDDGNRVRIAPTNKTALDLSPKQPAAPRSSRPVRPLPTSPRRNGAAAH